LGLDRIASGSEPPWTVEHHFVMTIVRLPDLTMVCRVESALAEDGDSIGAPKTKANRTTIARIPNSRFQG
jgi:hypothetical protein